MCSWEISVYKLIENHATSYDYLKDEYKQLRMEPWVTYIFRHREIRGFSRKNIENCYKDEGRELRVTGAHNIKLNRKEITHQ